MLGNSRYVSVLRLYTPAKSSNKCVTSAELLLRLFVTVIHCSQQRYCKWQLVCTFDIVLNLFTCKIYFWMFKYQHSRILEWESYLESFQCCENFKKRIVTKISKDAASKVFLPFFAYNCSLYLVLSDAASRQIRLLAKKRKSKRLHNELSYWAQTRFISRGKEDTMRRAQCSESIPCTFGRQTIITEFSVPRTTLRENTDAISGAAPASQRANPDRGVSRAFISPGNGKRR